MHISIGNSNFRELRTEQLFYVDKTDFLTEFFADGFPNKVTLITRPRRFGKTLMLSMLHEFFRNDQKTAEDIFAGLHISQNTSLCQTWQNTHPVISISFKDMKKRSLTDAIYAFSNAVATIYKNFIYLLDSQALTEYDKEYFQRILAQVNADKLLPQHLLSKSLALLCQYLEQHYRQKAIVLIDEYDVPIQTAYENGFYKEMVDFMRSSLGLLLKDNSSLCFAILTGCLRLAHESIFTGLNNFACYTISDNEFSDKFGFTDHEINILLKENRLSEKKQDIKNWYDGYRFGKYTEIYCPWDITNYLQKLSKDRNAQPESFWLNTSKNSIIKNCLQNKNYNIVKSVQSILDGNFKIVKLHNSITYDSLDQNNEDLFFSILYHTGYLTKSASHIVKNIDITYQDDKECFILPNKEIRKIFLDSFFQEIKYTIETNKSDYKIIDQTEILDMFFYGKNEILSNTISELLINTISYFDYNEIFYHAFLVGTLSTVASSHLVVVSNSERGLGRPDILIYDLNKKRSCCIEIKVSDTPDDLVNYAKQALQQIRTKQYDITRSKFSTNMINWGIAFAQKACCAVCERPQKSC